MEALFTVWWTSFDPFAIVVVLAIITTNEERVDEYSRTQRPSRSCNIRADAARQMLLLLIIN